MHRMPRSAVLVLTALPLLSCGPSAQDAFAPRLVLLYAPCTVAKSFLGPYRANVDFTPDLSRLAERA